jgi:hypothetical protein
VAGCSFIDYSEAGYRFLKNAFVAGCSFVYNSEAGYRFLQNLWQDVVLFITVRQVTVPSRICGRM